MLLYPQLSQGLEPYTHCRLSTNVENEKITHRGAGSMKAEVIGTWHGEEVEDLERPGWLQDRRGRSEDRAAMPADPGLHLSLAQTLI